MVFVISFFQNTFMRCLHAFPAIGCKTESSKVVLLHRRKAKYLPDSSRVVVMDSGIRGLALFVNCIAADVWYITRKVTGKVLQKNLAIFRRDGLCIPSFCTKLVAEKQRMRFGEMFRISMPLNGLWNHHKRQAMLDKLRIRKSLEMYCLAE